MSSTVTVTSSEIDAVYSDTTDTTNQLMPLTAGVSGPITVQASAAVFAATDVGRGLTIRQDCAERAPATAYAVGAVFYSNYNGTTRVYRVMAAGTTAPILASGTTPDYDENAPYAATDSVVDGSALLIYLGAGQQAYGFGVITAFIDAEHVTVDVDPLGPFPSTVPSLRWALGDWSDARGWPNTVTFWQERLLWGGSNAKPDTIWFSQSGDFNNMGALEPDGTVLDTDAIVLGLDDDQVNLIRWMKGVPRGLMVGTASGEFLVAAASSTTLAISPSNILAQRQTDRGSLDIDGVRVSGVVLFVQRAGRKLRELQYQYFTDTFTTTDLTDLSDHIAGQSFLELAYREEPDGTVWLVTLSGTLVSMTYDREQKVRAWSRHIMGGQGAVVESVCVTPNPAGDGDDVYVAVARTVNGQVLRTIEYIQQPFRADIDGANGGYFVDCGLQYDGAPATVFSGLDHLDGQTVAICADGAAVPNQMVVGGAVTLATAASIVSVGLPYTSTLTTLPPEIPQDGTIQNKLKRFGDVALRFLETRGGQIVADDGSVTLVQDRRAWAQMTMAEPLFTGDKRIAFPGGADRRAQLTVQQTQPLPMTLLAITYELTTNA